MKFKEFLFTAAYAGYCPIAPGTAGTLVAMALSFLGHLALGDRSWIANAAAILVCFYPFTVLAGEGERFFNRKDPPQVVVDEMIGYWVSILFHPFSVRMALAAFILFRVLDVIKPWPASRLERIGGGLGIMIDDCVAGAYANLILLAAAMALKYFNIALF